jgi:hypothetical protein
MKANRGNSRTSKRNVKYTFIANTQGIEEIRNFELRTYMRCVRLKK